MSIELINKAINKFSPIVYFHPNELYYPIDFNDYIKEAKIKDINNSQNNILSNTDWYYIRKTDKGTAIPTDIQNYRDAVRTAGDGMITDITSVTDKAGFKSLYPVWDGDGNNTGGTVDIWPDPKDYNL